MSTVKIYSMEELSDMVVVTKGHNKNNHILDFTVDLRHVEGTEFEHPFVPCAFIATMDEHKAVGVKINYYHVKDMDAEGYVKSIESQITSYLMKLCTIDREHSRVFLQEDYFPERQKEKEEAMERLNDQLRPWYLDDTSVLAGVTASSSNQYLGIQNINLFAPSPEEEAKGVLCAVLVHTSIGNIRTAVRQRADMEGILLLDRVDSIALNPKVEAQVLRFVHSQCEVRKRS